MVLAAVVVIPIELGGYGKIFASIDPKLLETYKKLGIPLRRECGLAFHQRIAEPLGKLRLHIREKHEA